MLKDLSRAAAGLVMISETDSEFVPFVSAEPVTDVRLEILRMSGRSASEPIAVEDAAEFFARRTLIADRFGEIEMKRAERFARLKETLDEYLTSLKVYRVGRVRVDIFIAGLDQEGYLAGVRTFAVET
ncbi:MAG: nuclease A inhibitor family protein [Pyrinomonadaceae bacterium]